MIYKFGVTPVGEWKNLNLTTSIPVRSNPYWIEILTKDLITKKIYSFGAPDCVIKKVKYEESEKGSLNATIEVQYFDILIEYGDFVIVRYNGERDYIGYVVEVPDVKGGTIKVDSLLNMAKRVVYTGSFTAKTKKEFLETIIVSLFSTSHINWNTALVELTSLETFSPNYNSIQLDTILDEWGKSEEDSFWLINTEQFFQVKLRDSAISKTIFPGSYENYKYTEDWKKIKFTVIDLWRNVEDVDGNKREVFVGQIPDGSSEFPYFQDTEDVIGRIIKKELAPDELTVDEAKTWAYGEVQAQILPTKKLDLNSLKRDISIRPGNLVRAYLKQDYDFRELIDSESLDNWTLDAALDPDSYDGSYSVLVNGTALYTFPFIKAFADIKKLILFAKSSTYGNAGTIEIIIDYSYILSEDGDYLTDESGNLITNEGNFESIGNVFIKVPDNWNYIEIPISQRIIKYLKFKLTNTNVDFIHFFAICSRYHDLHCVNRSIDIDRNSFDIYDVELGSYNRTSNDIQFAMAKTIERRSK